MKRNRLTVEDVKGLPSRGHELLSRNKECQSDLTLRRSVSVPWRHSLTIVLFAAFISFIGVTSPFVHQVHADEVAIGAGAVDAGSGSDVSGIGAGGDIDGMSVSNEPAVTVTATVTDDPPSSYFEVSNPIVTPPNIAPQGGGSVHSPKNKVATAAKKNNPNPCPDNAGDPIMMSSGNKAIEVTEFAEPGEMGLKFERFYNSAFRNDDTDTSSLIGSWATSVDFHLYNTACFDVNGIANPCGDVRLTRPDGSSLYFSPVTTIYEPTEGGISIQQTGPFKAAGAGTLSYASGIYTVHDEDSHILTFDANGNLLSIKDTSGIGWTITHTGGLTDNWSTTVTHTNGQSYSIKIIGNGASGARQVNVTDPAGNVYNYGTTPTIGIILSLTSYIGRIDSVTYPGSPSHIVSYKYQSPQNTIIDELIETDVNGVAHDLTTYDSNGHANMTSMADGSQKLSIGYATNSSGQITSATQTNALGHVNVFQYSNGLLTSITGDASAHCAASYASSTYDANGNMTSSKDNNGNVTNYTYAASGLLQKKVEAAGSSAQRTIDYVWDSAPGTDRPLSITVEGLSKTAYTYDSHNKLASTTVTNLTGVGNIPPLVTSYSYTYQSNGLVATKKVTRPSANNADTTTYTYDAHGYLALITDGLGHTQTFQNFTGLGEPTAIINANGDVTNYAYDARGRVTNITHSHSGATNAGMVSYDANSGEPSLIVAFDNEQTRNSYDADFKLTKSVWTGPSGASITTAYTYDANGDVTGVTKTLAGSSTPAVSQSKTYDELGRVISVSGNHGQKVSIGYDLNGNPVSSTDALGHTTTTAYDALNRAVKVTDANGKIRQAVYGTDDKVHQFTDNRGLSTTYSYDGFGNVWTLNSPDTGSTSYGYGTYGHLVTVTPATGITIAYNYDSVYRVTSQVAGGETHTFTYDNCTNGVGLLCSESAPNTSSSYTYTPEGWLAQRTNNSTLGAGIEDYAYDGMGRMIRLTQVTSGGAYVDYHWTDDQVSSVTVSLDGGAAQTVVSNVTYDVMRHPISWTYGNGLGHSQTYDSDGRLTGIATSNSVEGMGFSYDNANRLSNVTNSVYSVQTQNYTYDSVDRLTNMTGAAPLDITYDANGNRISQDGQAGGTFSIASGSNRLLARGTHTYAYNARGDRIQDAVSGSTLTYTYDGFGRLRTASRDTSATICQTFNACPTYPAGTMTYSFSARGQRMSKSDPNGESMWYSYLPNGQLSSTLSNKSGYNYYIYLAGQPIGLVRNPLVYDVNTLYFIHADRMGRPESITDASQTRQWTALNFAFDSALFWEGAVAGIDIGLPGQVYDSETGNWSNGFRDYDSSNGRYLESDPIGLGGGMNTYAYVGGNPLYFTDPFGLAHITGVPGNAVQYQAGDGTLFYAPTQANWGAVKESGYINGPDPVGIKAAVSQYGMYDFQRSGGDFYTQYTPASNYAVGVFMEGAGFSLDVTIFISQTFANLMSSNAGDPNQKAWWVRGWCDAYNNSLAKPFEK